MEVKRLSWLGIRTARLAETSAFVRDVLGLPVVYEGPGFAMFKLPSGTHDYVEIFGSDSKEGSFYTTGPVVGLLVDDLELAQAEMEAAGLEVLDAEIQSVSSIEGYRWFHFRGPDGNVYALVEGSP